ncbi:MAG: phage minor tail protein L, partial [Janthinobacterium lividum]
MSTQHLAEGTSLSPDALVELFTLDTSQLTNIYGQSGSGAIYTWTAGTINGAMVHFAGVGYAPLPIETAGFEWNGQGKLPRPTLKVANISGLASGLVIEFGDMLGARVTRVRTYAKFLDGQPNADSSAAYEPDEFRVDRKAVQNKHFVQWELAADFDQMNIRLPKRQVLRDACSETYR